MRNAVKYGLVGFIGYLVGFYEMKYKTMKIMLKAQLEKDTKTKEEEVQ